jgi:hypothetical protein
MGIPERWFGHIPLPEDVETCIERMVPLFEREGVLLAYIFGSLSNKEGNGDKEPHDVDLGILTWEGSAHRLHDEITKILGTDRLDLIDLRMADPMLRFEILKKGRPIYTTGKDCQEDFILMTLQEYRDTAPMRRRQNQCLRRRMERWVSESRG